MAKAVAAELNAAITPEETHQIEKKPTTNLTAYDFYQRGKAEYDRFRLDNKENSYLETAEKLYKEALENDPEFAAAYTGLAEVYRTRNWNKEYFSENYMDSVLTLAYIAL